MRVLIAVDSSAGSQRVLQTALGRPWPAQTSFCVLNIVDLQRFANLPALIQDATREGEMLVSQGAAKLSAAGYQAVTRVVPGHPRGEISACAREWGADLILVGSHGHSAIGRFLLGSVAQGVLRTAPCSVEIVRAAAGAPASPRPMKILLATDGSECSAKAVRAAAQQPWPKGTVFKVISVQDVVDAANPPETTSLVPIISPSLIEELTIEGRKRAELAVEAAKEMLEKAGQDQLEPPAMPPGEPRSWILDTARNWGADLIVVGSHGRRGLDRLILGSVSEAVAVHAHCSVRVVRP